MARLTAMRPEGQREQLLATAAHQAARIAMWHRRHDIALALSAAGVAAIGVGLTLMPTVPTFGGDRLFIGLMVLFVGASIGTVVLAGKGADEAHRLKHDAELRLHRLDQQERDREHRELVDALRRSQRRWWGRG